jgi:hypothetical protein
VRARPSGGSAATGGSSGGIRTSGRAGFERVPRGAGDVFYGSAGCATSRRGSPVCRRLRPLPRRLLAADPLRPRPSHSPGAADSFGRRQLIPLRARHSCCCSRTARSSHSPSGNRQAPGAARRVATSTGRARRTVGLRRSRAVRRSPSRPASCSERDGFVFDRTPAGTCFERTPVRVGLEVSAAVSSWDSARAS